MTSKEAEMGEVSPGAKHDDEWWFPNRAYCGACGTCEESFGELLKPCPKCKAVLYCGPDCQKKHYEHHKEHCATLKYLEQDSQFLKGMFVNSEEDIDVAFRVLIELARLLHPAYRLRVEGNQHFAKQNWSEAAKKYETAIEIMEEKKDMAKEMLEGASLRTITVDAAIILWELNQTRIISNLSWCYMKVAYESIGSNVVALFPDFESWVEGSQHIRLTDGTWLLPMMKDESMLEESRSVMKNLFRRADEALQRVPMHGTIWWKISYRRAQLLQLMMRPQDAMKEVETGRRVAKESSPLYDPEKESESALHQLKILSEDIQRVLMVVDKEYSRSEKQRDGKPQGVLAGYLQAKLTPLTPNHPRVPMSSVREEMLAVRLLAATEVVGFEGPGVDSNFNPKGEATQLLNEILSTVAQPPLNLFPASGSGERVPPISIHLLAFYFRACLTDVAMKEFAIEEFCEKVTGWISDEEAYAIATHAFVEVENAHDPNNGHAKTFRQTAGGGCMPCSFRLLRAGHDSWSDGLQQAVHVGRIEWTAFCLNRLLCGIDGKTVVDTILEADVAGCNSMMHAANDNTSGFSGLSVRLLAQAASFSVADFNSKPKAVRRILNTCDRHGFTPAMACVSLGNTVGLSAFVALGARLWDKNVNTHMSRNQIAMLEASVSKMGAGNNENVRNMIRSLQTKSNEEEPCSYCGKPPKQDMGRLLFCSRCNRTGYCSRECQKKHYKKHKYVCTTAKVDEGVDFYNSNITVPKP